MDSKNNRRRATQRIVLAGAMIRPIARRLCARRSSSCHSLTRTLRRVEPTRIPSYALPALEPAPVRRPAAHTRRMAVARKVDGLAWVGLVDDEFVGCWWLQPPTGPIAR